MSRHGTYDLKYGFIPDEDCPQETPKPSNADRIRGMTDEELATWIAGRKETCPPVKFYGCSFKTCEECWLDWLKGGE